MFGIVKERLLNTSGPADRVEVNGRAFSFHGCENKMKHYSPTCRAPITLIAKLISTQTSGYVEYYPTT